MADAKADKVQSPGSEVAENYDALNFINGISASESDGVVSVEPATGERFIVAANTNGTTAVSVFGATGLPYAITITGVYLVARS